MNHSSIPGFSTTTNCPRTGRTDGSGTSSRAPSPVQLTTTRAASTAARSVTVRVSTVPPAATNRSPQPAQMDRHVDQRQPRPQPARTLGQLLGASPSRSPATRAAHGPERVQPLTGVYARDHAYARLVGPGRQLLVHAQEASAHSPASSSGSIRYGHHSAPATADVVRSAGSRVHTRTRRPLSARTTAVVSPMTPPPTTITSLFDSWSSGTVAE